MDGVEAVLLAVGLALHEQHLLGEAVGRVRLLGVAVPEVVLAERHRRELRVRADGADLDELLDAGEPGLLHELDAHDRVLVEEPARVLAVGADAADDGGEVDDHVAAAPSASARVDAVARCAGRSRRCAGRRSPRHRRPRAGCTTAWPRKPPPPVTMTRLPAIPVTWPRPSSAAKRPMSTPASARSASSISRTSSSNVVRGASRAAREPWRRRRTARRPRSAGSSARRCARSASQSSPTRPKATSHSSRTRVHLAGRDDVVVRLRLLEHQPHRLDVLLGVAPVAPRVEVAEVEVLALAREDRRDAAGDLAGDERAAAPRRLVVEQDPVAGVEAVRLAVLDGHEWAKTLAIAYGLRGLNGVVSDCGGLGDLAVHLRAARLVEPDRPVGSADRLEQPERAHAGGVGRELRHLEADLDVALGAEVVDLVRLDPVQVRR